MSRLSPSKQQRSKSLEFSSQNHNKRWIKSFIRGFGSLIRSKQKNKSEKSVYSQTEDCILRLQQETGIQVNSTINNSSSKNFRNHSKIICQLDLKTTDKRRHSSIYNQILQDVLSHFPAVENSLDYISEFIINEICVTSIREAVHRIYRMPSCNNNLINVDSTAKISNYFSQEICVDNVLDYKNMDVSFLFPKYYSNKRSNQLKHPVCKRFIIKKSNTSKSSDKNKTHIKFKNCKSIKKSGDKKSKSLSPIRHPKFTDVSCTKTNICTISISSLETLNDNYPSVDNNHNDVGCRISKNIEEISEKKSEKIYFIDESNGDFDFDEHSLRNKPIQLTKKSKNYIETKNYEVKHDQSKSLSTNLADNKQFFAIKNSQNTSIVVQRHSQHHEKDVISPKSSILLDIEIVDKSSNCSMKLNDKNKSDYTINDIQTLNSNSELYDPFRNSFGLSSTNSLSLEKATEYKIPENNLQEAPKFPNKNLNNNQDLSLELICVKSYDRNAKYANSLSDNDTMFWGCATEETVSAKFANITDEFEPSIVCSRNINCCEVVSDKNLPSNALVIQDSLDSSRYQSDNNKPVTNKKMSLKNFTFLNPTISSKMKMKRKNKFFK